MISPNTTEKSRELIAARKLMFPILRDEGKRLVITNGGSAVGVPTDAPCVTHVDVASGDLLERELIPHARINAGQLTWQDFGGLHPGPKGHRLYAGSIGRLFDAAWSEPVNRAPPVLVT